MSERRLIRFRQYTYIGTVVGCFLISLGNRPQGCALLLLFARRTIQLTNVEQIEMEVSSRDCTVRHHYGLHVRSSGILHHRCGAKRGIYHLCSDCHFSDRYLCVHPYHLLTQLTDLITDGTYVVSSLLALDPWHLGWSLNLVARSHF